MLSETADDREARLAAWPPLVAALQAQDGLADSPLACGLLAAVGLGLAGDSRGFARDSDTEHALVLREVGRLSDELGLLVIVRTDERTQRRFLALSEAGQALIEGQYID
ncbi:formate dehydrogenase F4B subunit [Rhizobium sp. NFR07]|jgi:hypothetical protein|uniref:hypothetical protein n=1 Tax=Rhizobium sp. NFR07 TaxID=1566262 RepID=UPI0008E5EF65|nr:hypothetical protein [Rhizobium sp. NFR07]SFA74642.1 formate dehydrogenase F4B subunit [Rhizobium sp. NFR07]